MAAVCRFQMESLLHAVQAYRVTHLPIVPPIAAALTKAWAEKTDKKLIFFKICIEKFKITFEVSAIWETVLTCQSETKLS